MHRLYSEEATVLLRALVASFRHHERLSLEALALDVANGGDGPSPSTLSRFLNSSGGDLSIGQTRLLLTYLKRRLHERDFLAVQRVFVDRHRSELEFFELIEPEEPAGGERSEAARILRNAGVLRNASNLYVLSRSLGSDSFIISLVEFIDDRDNAVCTIHRVTGSGARVSMQCDLDVLSGMIYVRGLNPLNQTFRQLSFAPRDVSGDAFSGFMSGFENPGVSFASKTVMARIQGSQDREAFIEGSSELHDEGSLASLYSSLCDPVSVNLVRSELAQSGYLRISSEFM